MAYLSVHNYYMSVHKGSVSPLTHRGRVTHICVGKLSIIGSDNGLSPGRRQAIIWTNAGILLIGPLGTNFSENWIGIETFSIKEMHLKISSAKWRLFGLGLNELKLIQAVRLHYNVGHFLPNPLNWHPMPQIDIRARYGFGLCTVISL